MATTNILCGYNGIRRAGKRGDLQDVINVKDNLTFNLDSKFLIVHESLVPQILLDKNVHIATADGGNVGLDNGELYYLFSEIVLKLNQFGGELLSALKSPTITQEGSIFVAHDGVDVASSTVLGYGRTSEEAQADYLNQ